MFLPVGCRFFLNSVEKKNFSTNPQEEEGEKRGSLEGNREKKKRIKIWRKGNASVKLQWADRWSRYNVFLRACVERERKRIISYRACQRDW